MPRITTSDIQPGDPVNIADLNADQTALRSVGTAGGVDGANVPSQGIDRCNLATESILDRPVGGRELRKAEADKATITATAAPATTDPPLDFNGARAAIGAFAYDSTDGEYLEVVCSIAYKGEQSSNVNPQRWNVQLAYSTDWNGTTGNWTFIPVTRRRLGIDGNTSVRFRGSLTIDHLFLHGNPMTTSDLWFGLFGWEDGGSGSTMDLLDLSFYANRRHR